MAGAAQALSRRLRRELLLVIGAVAFAACEQPTLVLTAAVVGPLPPPVPGADFAPAAYAEDVLFEHVLVPRGDGEMTSRTLARWSRELGGQRYRLQLAPDLRFTDGSLATPADLVASLEAAGVRVIDSAGELVAEPDDPADSLDELLLRAALFRRREGELTLGTRSYVLREATAQRIILQRVGAQQGVVELRLVAYATPRQAMAALLMGDANAFFYPDPATLELVDGDARFQLVEGPPVQVIGLLVNRRRLGPEARRAVERLAAGGNLARVLAGDPAIPGAQVSSDPSSDRSLVLLSPAIPSGLPRLARAIRRGMGGRLELRELPAHTTILEARAGRFDVAVFPFVSWPPPFALARWRSGALDNYGGYSNPKLDAAVAAGDWARAQRAFDADPPIVTVAPRRRFALVPARLRNVKLGPFGLLDSLATWTVDR